MPWVDKVTEDEKLDCCSSCLYRRSTSLPTKLIITSGTFQVQVLKQIRLYMSKLLVKTHLVVSLEAGNFFGTLAKLLHGFWGRCNWCIFLVGDMLSLHERTFKFYMNNYFDECFVLLMMLLHRNLRADILGGQF